MLQFNAKFMIKTELRKTRLAATAGGALTTAAKKLVISGHTYLLYVIINRQTGGRCYS